MVLDGPMNGEAFLAYVEQALVPDLRPGDVVIRPYLRGENHDAGAVSIWKTIAVHDDRCGEIEYLKIRKAP
jgi:hypothetical protein